MKIQYGIAGFMIGIMTGLLAGIIEMKLIKRFGLGSTITPFVIGITVIACIITGVVKGVKMGKRR